MSQTQEQQAETASAANSEEEQKKKTKSRRPPNTAFRQQRLKAWQPILTPKTVLPLFFAVGIIFAPIGGLLLWTSNKVQEIKIDYSDCIKSARPCDQGFDLVPSNKITQSFTNSSDEATRWCKTSTNVTYPIGSDSGYSVYTDVCRLIFGIPNTLQPPVLMYYELTNFYQNHRRYVKSFDQDQLSGHARSNSSINGSDCEPLRGELQQDGSWKAYYPCGLIANSLFNDTLNEPILLNTQGDSGANKTYAMTTNGTAWGSDADLYNPTSYKLGEVVPPPNWRKQYPTYNETFPFPDLHNDNRFQVWMRTAGLPTFSKLFRRNDNDAMTRGTYQIDIEDNFPVLLYDGTKSLLISTRTVMGGRNPFLGIAYVVVGGLCIVLGALFTLTQLIRPRKLGDHSYLSWNNEQQSSATTTGRASRPGEA